MIDKMKTYLSPNRFIPNDYEELTALELIGKQNNKIDEVVEGCNKLELTKVSQGSDFKGSWYGISKPQYAEPGIASVVDKLVNHQGDFVNVEQFNCVGDGVTDNTLAFNELLKTHKKLFIPKGQFILGEVDLNGCHLTGGGTLLKKKESPYCLGLGSDNIISDIFFSSFNESGQPNSSIKLLEGAKNNTITNNVFTGEIYSAICGSGDTLQGGELYEESVDGVIITNNTFIGYNRPIYLHCVKNVIISNNTIRDCEFDAIRLRENDGFVKILGNNFINIGNPNWVDSTQTRDCIDTYWSGYNLIIANNTIENCAFIGFDIKGSNKKGDNFSSRVIVEGNIISGCRYEGIRLNGEESNGKFISNVIINGNIITECNLNNKSGGGSIGQSAIALKFLCKYITITNNHIVSNYGRGIYVFNEKKNVSNCKFISIKNNTCVNNGQQNSNEGSGIYVNATSYLIVEGNTCVNDVNELNPNQSYGIVVNANDGNYSSGKTNSILNNVCSGNLIRQINFQSNKRLDCVATFKDNIESGKDANFRGVFQHQRRVLHGSGAPSSISDGSSWVKGDIIFNINPSMSGDSYIIGWVCVGDSTESIPQGQWEEIKTK